MSSGSPLLSSSMLPKGNVSQYRKNGTLMDAVVGGPCVVVVVPVDPKSGDLLTSQAEQQYFPDGVQLGSADEETVILHSAKSKNYAGDESREEEDDHLLGCCTDWEDSELAVSHSTCPVTATKVLSVINACFLVALIIAMSVTFGLIESDDRKYQSGMFVLVLIDLIFVVPQIIGSWKKSRETLRWSWWIDLICIPINIGVIAYSFMAQAWAGAGIGVGFVLFQIPWLIVSSRVLGRVSPRCCGCKC